MEKKFTANYPSNLKMFDTQAEAERFAAIRTATDRDGDEYIVFEAVSKARLTPPDNVEIIAIS